jgi:hypothetical protein
MAVFDTLKLARSLREPGMPGAQAEATAGALAEAFTGEIAEKRDIEVLRRDIEAASDTAKRDLDSAVAQIGARLTFQQWQLGLVTALVLGVLLKLFLR